MTRERRVAVEMWERVRDELLGAKSVLECRMTRDRDGLAGCEYSDDVFENADEWLSTLKLNILKKEGLSWRNNCWLCQYVGCSGCPLNDGRTSCSQCVLFGEVLFESPYSTVVNEDADIDARIEAAETIVAVHKGERNLRTEADDWYFLFDIDMVMHYGLRVGAAKCVRIRGDYEHASAEFARRFGSIQRATIKGGRAFRRYLERHTKIEMVESKE